MKLTDISRQVVGAFAIAGVSGLVLVGCNNSSAPESTTEGSTESAPAETSETTTTAASGDIDPNHTKIVIGTTEGDFADMVRNQVKSSLEAQGYEVELVPFTDYVRPNLALAEGDLDINIFQHKPYLDTFKQANNLDLVEVFQVPTAPLGLYSGKKTKIEEAYKGMSVSAPNDPSNFARALVMMQDLGWITLKEGIDPLTASKSDIADNSKYDIEIVELEAAQLPRARDEVDFAIINGNYATDAGIKLTDALAQEQSFAYINWSAVKTADKDAKWVQDVTAAYNSDAFKKYAHETFPGYKYPKIWGEDHGAHMAGDKKAASTDAAASTEAPAAAQ
ncbi:MetQ/NlpA family ABC transporter substrate-binding protein [Psychrobacter aestuarii]|uniref:MetQ/NlpA family ABC transporter substrate-binding protein n=1 Tax=Psychrobacter aestuarii TaxID=556327 RepID=A0ABN0VU16_9GAMM|nr:MetQ/NlpA family ABC transporter substrate-binding protein [Psychrobacter aestuarii]